ncbi:hypothetical protein EDB19DRAFT_1775126 [Suillus lakei]|nr:hypothetical protein EDB19DRAFT_1775126 [Suillus lakei]
MALLAHLIFSNAPEMSTVVSSSAGLLVADIHGSVYILNMDFVSTTSWAAHVGGRVLYMAWRKGVLVTTGKGDAVQGGLLILGSRTRETKHRCY